MKKISVFSLLSLVFLLTSHKLGIELNQNGFGSTGFYFIVTSHILKTVFLVLIVAFMLKGIRRLVKNLGLRILLGVLSIPVFLFLVQQLCFQEGLS